MNKIIFYCILVTLISTVSPEGPDDIISPIIPDDIVDSTESDGKTEDIVTEQWRYHVNKGVYDIITFDSTNDKIPEIYAVRYNQRQTTVAVVDPEGYLLYDMTIPRYMSYLYKTEEIIKVHVDDLNNDGILDIFAGSQIHTGGINLHYFYGIERKIERGLDRYYNRIKWQTKEVGGMTRIWTIKRGGKKMLLTGSIDHNIRIIDGEGKVVKEHLIPGTVWDLSPAQLDGDAHDEIVVGTFRKIMTLDNNWKTIWSYAAPKRFKKVVAADIDKDGKDDAFGMTEEKVIAFNHIGKVLWEYPVEKGSSIYVLDLKGGEYKNIVIADKQTLIFLNDEGSKVGSIDLERPILSLGGYSLREERHLLVGTNDQLIDYMVSTAPFKRKDAEYYLKTAGDYYKEDKLDKAIEYANKAKTVFQELKDQESISISQEIITNSEIIQNSDKLFEAASKHFEKSEYNMSREKAETALEGYRKVWRGTGIQKAEQLLSVIDDKKIADTLYAQAEKLFLENQFDNSIKKADEAKTIYSRINDKIGVQKANSLKKLINRDYSATTTIKKTGVTTTIPTQGIAKNEIITYIAIGLGVIIILLTLKRFLENM